MFAGAGSGRNDGTAHSAAPTKNLHLNGGPTAAIEDLTRVYTVNRWIAGHVFTVRTTSLERSITDRIEDDSSMFPGVICMAPWIWPRAAYLHVPFCAHHCGYCDFAIAV